MKSTLQYLALGLALGSVPLLAEAGEDRHEPTTRATPVSAVTLEGYRWLTLLEISGRTEQPMLHLGLPGSDEALLTISAMMQQNNDWPPRGARLEVSSERHGWSLGWKNRLLAFIPNQQGEALLQFAC